MSERIADLLEKHPAEMRPVLTFMGRIISQLISDRRVIYLVETQMIELTKAVREQERVMFGGANDKPSFSERLRGIEEAQARSRWLLRTVLSGVSALIIKAAWDIFVAALPHVKP